MAIPGVKPIALPIGVVTDPTAAWLAGQGDLDANAVRYSFQQILNFAGSGAPYSPANPSDWSPTPATVAEALDQLGARVKALETAGFVTIGDVTGLPVSTFSNDVPYVAMADVVALPVSTFTNDAGYITAADIPTNVSAFTNDVPYLIMSDVTSLPVSTFTNDVPYLVMADVTSLPISTFLNDVGFLTVTDLAGVNVSVLNNDVPYVDLATVSALPISTFTNDSGFITGIFDGVTPTDIDGFIAGDGIHAVTQIVGTVDTITVMLDPAGTATLDIQAGLIIGIT